MIQSGSRFEFRANQQTGELCPGEVPVMEPKQRNLTTRDLNALEEPSLTNPSTNLRVSRPMSSGWRG
jgi:hypothetical protein